MQAVRDLIQTGKDQDAFPLYFCRVKYWKQTWGEDYSVHPIALQAPRPYACRGSTKLRGMPPLTLIPLPQAASSL